MNNVERPPTTQCKTIVLEANIAEGQLFIIDRHVNSYFQFKWLILWVIFGHTRVEMSCTAGQ